MSGEGLQKKVLSGLVWKFGERIGAQLVSLLVRIILARILMPEDFGVVTMIMIFIEIANVFVVSGFGQSLIQKKDADNLDFSSVFYFSVTMSWILYFIIFLQRDYTFENYPFHPFPIIQIRNHSNIS